MIHLLWPTIRPAVMKQTYTHWCKTACDPKQIMVHIAVNTPQQREELGEFSSVYIVGDSRKGPVYATSVLAKMIQGQLKDIIILVSDDFFSPPNWDRWLCKIFEDFKGGIIVNDGYQMGNCVTIPIMTYDCLLKLNRIIYHPSYTWQYSDEELYHNLNEMRLLKNVRSNGLTFEHRHWVLNKRAQDEHDQVGIKSGGQDEANFKRRMRLPVRLRLQ